MTKTIRLDNINNYLISASTGELIPKYDPNNDDIQLVLQLDNSRLIVDSKNITMEYGNQIVVRYNDDLFIIDDGHQPILIKSGYIVYKNYDQENILNRDEGVSKLSEIMTLADDQVAQLMYRTDDEWSCIDVDNAKYHEYSFNHKGFDFYIKLNTVTSIVTKNQLRKDNSLPFYPFDKSMDKYGTIYISIFAQKSDENVDNSVKYDVANDFVKNLIAAMGPDFHFISQVIKRRIVMAKGL